jgi:hypothetical protein
MKLNYRKSIVDQIDEALESTPVAVESISLTRAERHELYRSGHARFLKNHVRSTKVRGWFYTTNHECFPVVATEEE